MVHYHNYQFQMNSKTDSNHISKFHNILFYFLILSHFHCFISSVWPFVNSYFLFRTIYHDYWLSFHNWFWSYCSEWLEIHLIYLIYSITTFNWMWFMNYLLIIFHVLIMYIGFYIQLFSIPSTIIISILLFLKNRLSWTFIFAILHHFLVLFHHFLFIL